MGGPRLNVKDAQKVLPVQQKACAKLIKNGIFKKSTPQFLYCSPAEIPAAGLRGLQKLDLDSQGVIEMSESPHRPEQQAEPSNGHSNHPATLLNPGPDSA